MTGTHPLNADSAPLLGAAARSCAVILVRSTEYPCRRLNTGGVTLNPQEIRNSTWPGPLNDLLLDLSESNEFRSALGITKPSSSALYKEMRDVELVLRFFTFRDDWATFSGGMAKRLDKFMAENQRAPKRQLAVMRASFLSTLEVCQTAFGEYAFRRFVPDRDLWRRPILAALFDAQMFAGMTYRAETFQGRQHQLVNAYQRLFSTADFRRSIDAATNTHSCTFPKAHRDHAGHFCVVDTSLMATNALANHLVANEGVTALLTLEGHYADPPAVEDQPLVEALRGSASVLMVAAFEQYLKESIPEVIDGINTATPPCDFNKLPDTLKTSAVFAALEIAMKGAQGDPPRSRSDRLPDIFGKIGAIHARKLDSSALAQTGGNPSPDKVKSMFKAIGMPHAMTNIKSAFDTAWRAPTANTFISDTLEAVVRRRHLVAHTASALQITRGDLADGQRFLLTLASVLDAALERHGARVIARAQ